MGLTGHSETSLASYLEEGKAQGVLEHLDSNSINQNVCRHFHV